MKNNAYVTYMNSIEVDGELHRRLLEGAGAAQPRRRRPLLPAAAGLAAALALSFAMLWAPGLQSEPPSVADPAPGTPVQSAPPGVPDDFVGTLQFPRQTIETDAARVLPPEGYFERELSREELEELFPVGLPALFTDSFDPAVAGYTGQGEFYCLRLAAQGEQQLGLAVSQSGFTCGVTQQSDAVLYRGTWVQCGSDTGGEHWIRFEQGGLHWEIRAAGEDAARRAEYLLGELLPDNLPDVQSLRESDIPEWENRVLTLSEARSDGRFGSFVPQRAPKGFSFESARRYRDWRSDGLNVLYTDGGYGTFELRVRAASEDDAARVLDPEKREAYDTGLYEIPWADSVPQQYAENFDNPVFLAQDVTAELLGRRMYHVEDAGDAAGVRVRLSVLLDDTLVEVSGKGLEQGDAVSVILALLEE
ncbi:hypothetical protein [Feifania hominis]|uniref:Uncharacterized protein n=1 Tax=Feifania hominis TaxID=2763660 RepID=A0A926HR10_9FIRM|nr:hypothetical protein [Feifania hominis]MBC8536927.1 hypothetical protein [Feifania hominis]